MVKMQILVASLNKGFSFIEVIVTLLIISLVGSSFYIFFQNSNIPISLNVEIKKFQDILEDKINECVTKAKKNTEWFIFIKY